MSEYRRFVAYIYAYQDGRRQKNTGYIKVEVRDQICRMRIQMQTAVLHSRSVSAYGFIRMEEVILAIPLGEGVSRNGNLEIRLSMRAEGLNGTPYGIKDLQGIWLKDEEDMDYFSIWDDESVDVGKIVWELPEEQEKAEEICDHTAVVEVEAAEATVESPMDGKRLSVRWEHFVNHYPTFYPFGETEEIHCLKIAPKDISFLGETQWQFGQSPFVKQGYIRYGHLLLGMQREGGCILGVPGMYYDAQDRHLARMYGFSEFRKADSTEEIQLPEGEDREKFGYWYHRIID